MKEIRDIKLDLLMGNKNTIVDLFNEITKELQIINCEVYNDDGLEFIYYNKENEWIFYQDAKNGKFWCDYNRYWSFFREKLNLEYKEIQAITKLLVEEALKREVDTPDDYFGMMDDKVEEALKREVDTPRYGGNGLAFTVEEALKREVDTPCVKTFNRRVKVEEALKREVDFENR
jgi:hypothetical protein